MSDLVTVEVVETSRTGVQVRILDSQYANRVGFIRRQELSWDQRVDSDVPMPLVGDQLLAKVLGGRDARFVRLSLRLGNPWETQHVEERFREGQIVKGHVTQLSRYGAFVQLLPGVDALARMAAIPLPRYKSLEDVLSVGDEIQAVITEIDLRRMEIAIDLTKRLQQLTLLSMQERRTFQMSLFEQVPPSEREASLPAPLGILGNRSTEPSLQREYPSLAKLERVLIVEDDELDRWEMRNRLEASFHVWVDCVESGKEALEKSNEGTQYDLILMDVNLRDEDAIEISTRLSASQPHSLLVFMSHDPHADEKLPRDRAFVLKDQGFASILQWIMQVHQGDRYQAQKAGAETILPSEGFVRHLGMEAFGRRSLEETLQLMLHRLRLQSRVTWAIVFRVDSVEKEVSIVATDPIIEGNTSRYLLDRLYFSPVQNVVEDEEPYYETNTLIRRHHPRFKRLYQVLPFRSCLGLPLTIPDLEIRYALFLFDEDRSQFELEDLDNARIAARFLQVALERATFFDFMQRYEARYSRGLLIGSLMHELAIKLNTLEALAETLPTVLKKVTMAVRPSERADSLQAAGEIAEELRENKQELRDLTDAYLQMAKENWEAVDVNAVVDKVKLQMNKLAEETEVTIHVEASDSLPHVRAISSRLEQILLNLVLNAIQQIGRQRETMAKLPSQKANDPMLLQKGQVIIETRYVEKDPVCPIQILVIDTGPGIRYRDQKHIFRLDTTTREKGHGWGLFISRNLVEIMRGRLRLVGSVRFIGSAFAVELPAFSSNGGI